MTERQQQQINKPTCSPVPLSAPNSCLPSNFRDTASTSIPKPSSDISQIDQIISNSSLEQIRIIALEMKANIIEKLKDIGEGIKYFALSGRGEKDLALIEETKTGSYPQKGGGDLLVWMLSSVPENIESTFENLMSAALGATSYASDNSVVRLRLDPNPGGVMVIKAPQSKVRIRVHCAELYNTKDPKVGETQIDFSPDTFDQRYCGKILYSEVADLWKQIRKIGAARRKIEVDNGSNPNQAAIDKHAELCDRYNLGTKIAGSIVLAKALDLFAPSILKGIPDSTESTASFLENLMDRERARGPRAPLYDEELLKRLLSGEETGE